MNSWVKTIFRHETPQGGAWYSVAVSGKDQEGAKKYEYWPVDFPQGTEIPDRARVEFKDFFISFYTRRDGGTQYKFVVQDFLLQEGPAAYPQQRTPQGYRQPARSYGQQPQNWSGGWQRQQQAPQQAPDFDQLDEEVPF